MIRLGFLGLGWIGRNRMDALLRTGLAEAVAIVDPDAGNAARARELAPSAKLAGSLEEVLALKPDGVVIATPSALHAEQSIAALSAGVAVFCQKPLGRGADEVGAVIEASRATDRPLGVDLSYRDTAAIEAVRAVIQSGELGRIFAVELVFHNAYGPQSGWFWDRRLSGGGCLIDLGVHLVDLALWLLDWPALTNVQARLFREGRLPAGDEVEDYALAQFELDSGTSVRLACSWNLAAGCDADIRATFHGSEGAVEMRNLGGSYFDFTAERFRGRDREVISSPPDDWGGRTAVRWLRKLRDGEGFDGTTAGLLQTAEVLDRLYAAARQQSVEDFAQSTVGPGERLIDVQGGPRPH